MDRRPSPSVQGTGAFCIGRQVIGASCAYRRTISVYAQPPNSCSANNGVPF